MKKSNQNPEIITDISESAKIHRIESNAVAIQEINHAEDRITILRDGMQKDLIKVINEMSSQGRMLEIITQREQLDFTFYTGFADRLPKGWDYDTAKKRMSLAKALPRPVKNFSELQNEIRKWTLQEMELLPMLESIRGGETRAINLQDGLGKWCSHIITFKQEYLKAIQERPMIERTPSEWRKVIDETEWLALARAEASRLLEAQGN